MDLDWSPDDLAFVEEVRAFLAAALTPELREAGRLMTSVYGDHEASMEWQRRLHARGWAAPAWPKAYGGAEWSVVQRYIYARERAIAGAPPVSPMGISMCAPALLGYGTEAQKQFFLPRMLSGEHFWCQGYSETEAGSDLASLQMWAEDDGDHFVCTGRKLWSTHAHLANWVFCLVRTRREDRPQRGITFLLIPMDAPGVSVRPIVSTSGEHIQNEILFESVRVPKDQAVGAIGDGWTVAKYLLEFERGGSAYAPELGIKLDRIHAAAVDAGADSPAFRARLAEARQRIDALEVYEFRAMSGARPIRNVGGAAAAPSIMKILGTELSQHLTELALEVAGDYGQPYQPQRTRPGGEIHLRTGNADPIGPDMAAIAPLRYLNERAGSIYAGSNEIQRNIIAKAAFGL